MTEHLQPCAVRATCAIRARRMSDATARSTLVSVLDLRPEWVYRLASGTDGQE